MFMGGSEPPFTFTGTFQVSQPLWRRAWPLPWHTPRLGPCSENLKATLAGRR